MSDCLLTDPATPCLLRPEGHPGSELAKVMEIKECSVAVHCTNCALLHGITHLLVIIFVAYQKEHGWNELLLSFFFSLPEYVYCRCCHY